MNFTFSIEELAKRVYTLIAIPDKGYLLAKTEQLMGQGIYEKRYEAYFFGEKDYSRIVSIYGRGNFTNIDMILRNEELSPMGINYNRENLFIDNMEFFLEITRFGWKRMDAARSILNDEIPSLIGTYIKKNSNEFLINEKIKNSDKYQYVFKNRVVFLEPACRDMANQFFMNYLKSTTPRVLKINKDYKTGDKELLLIGSDSKWSTLEYSNYSELNIILGNHSPESVKLSSLGDKNLVSIYDYKKPIDSFEIGPHEFNIKPFYDLFSNMGYAVTYNEEKGGRSFYICTETEECFNYGDDQVDINYQVRISDHHKFHKKSNFLIDIYEDKMNYILNINLNERNENGFKFESTKQIYDLVCLWLEKNNS